MSSFGPHASTPRFQYRFGMLQPNGILVILNLTPTEHKILCGLTNKGDQGITKFDLGVWLLSSHINRLKRKYNLQVVCIPNKEPGKRCARYIMPNEQRQKLQGVRYELNS